MKIKSLFLGSAAAVALSSGAMAADPIGVALDTCSLLGITGLTVSSDSNCLKFSGEVSYEFVYDLSYDAAGPDDDDDSSSEFGWEFTMEATADSDFGPAKAVVTLEQEDGLTTSDDVRITEAFVSIGDQTVITAGNTGSIANEDDDESFGYFEVGFADIDGRTFPGGEYNIGGHVIQVSHDVGNGVSVSVGLEHLEGANSGGNFGSLVGVVAADQDWGTAHFTVVADDVLRDGDGVSPWIVHTGATFNATDELKLRAAAWFEDNGTTNMWAVLGASEYTFDMFTLAVAAGAESAATERWWAELSGSADVTDGVSLTAAYMYDSVDNSVSDTYTQSFAAEMSADVSDNLTATFGVEHVITTVTGTSTDDTDISAELAWAPGGGYDASIGLTADTDGDDTRVTAEFSKAFE
ncbi:porin [Maritalea mediterranea]|nr:porin [Maritalea mediterranea]